MVVDLLSRAEGEPEATALTGPDRAWTYRELSAEVDARSGALLAEGAVPGEVRPAVIGPDADGVLTLLAHWRAGLTPAPLHPGLTAPERDAAARALAGVAGDAQAVLWTSGTGGRARGVALSFEGLRASATAAAARLALSAEDVWLATLSPAHVGGLALITRSLLLGGRLLALGPVDATRTAELLDEVTHLSLVPTQLLRLLETRSTPPPDTFRCALVGGAHAPLELVRRALDAGWPISLTYGLTEATSQVATAPPPLTRRKPGTVGRPLDGVEVCLDEDGEIRVRGATLAVSYVGTDDSSLTDPHGWHRTGDLGRFDDDGDLWVSGRRGDRIVTGGVTVDAVEVEEALRAHPDIVDAGVVGLPDDEWGEVVAAWLEPAGGVAAAPDLRELDRFLRERLSKPKLPRVYHAGETLPRNANGKLDRSAVRDVLSKAARR